jgi:hypothetical protein
MHTTLHVEGANGSANNMKIRQRKNQQEPTKSETNYAYQNLRQLAGQRPS